MVLISEIHLISWCIYLKQSNRMQRSALDARPARNCSFL